ncbi:GNAT family N-acetyltransferase [Galbibacter pacificus]|uniref:GNAT family N-acetyltransferase n=1 Tax=Galbibacter pacificus TaxID=2996052 RepID=A0ABT6FSM8_9FLAO|nr:GNAT family N-acetyltransferase [Galbibacter pacificus]MDG3582625.1 GNAT family N-acetyltransferase [Galbibacter pacificus]MDG3586256.1 GNAT family N-acetyltransferase [Galbibacter pacificus]
MVEAIEFSRASSKIDLAQILKLQQENLPDKLTSEEKRNEGFVTVVHSYKMLKQLNGKCAHFIAKYNHCVVGYALAMHPYFKDKIEVLKPMFKILDKVLANTNYMVMGQICIDKDFRRQGIFKQLYKEMSMALKTDFNCIVTEVDATNKRSLDAHFSIGFINIKTYKTNQQEWVLLKLQL